MSLMVRINARSLMSIFIRSVNYIIACIEYYVLKILIRYAKIKVKLIIKRQLCMQADRIKFLILII